MTKLDEGTDFKTYLEDVNSFTDKIFSDAAPNSNIMMLGGERYRVESASTGIMNIYPYNGDNVADEDFYPFLITKRGGKYYLRFRDVVTKGDAENEATAQTFVYDETTDKFVDADNEVNVIEGGLPAPFFTECLDGGSTWRWVRNMSASDYMQSLNDKLYDDFKALTYTLTTINFTKNDDSDFVCTLPFTFKMGRVTVSGSASYLFTIADETETSLTLSYKGPGNDTGSLLLGTIPSLNEFVNQLSTTYNIEAQTSRFDMRTLRLTDAGDASKWFVVTLFN